jgi:trans-aconitate methyltransferase
VAGLSTPNPFYYFWGVTKHAMRDLVASYPHMFDGLNSLVDVGGGTGTAVKIIADAFPFLRCTVLDLPHVVANALENDSFNAIAGDMFEKIPPADVILLKVTYFSLNVYMLVLSNDHYTNWKI